MEECAKFITFEIKINFKNLTIHSKCTTQDVAKFDTLELKKMCFRNMRKEKKNK